MLRQSELETPENPAIKNSINSTNLKTLWMQVFTTCISRNFPRYKAKQNADGAVDDYLEKFPNENS